ncbi:winged helix DNA-binding protein [Sphingomonas sp.]|jgi:hypothetical protein|uniref:winged helix DNA-binding protein n=1 Tax=Sphingomonas sp. TaxID=28214 RepID=UPI003450A1F8
MANRFDTDSKYQERSQPSDMLADCGIGVDHIEAARAIYSARRQRDFHFDGLGLFGDPAWDIMLALLIDRAEGKSTCLTSACIASYVPQTTAIRWIDKLVAMNLLSRSGDPQDGRRSLLSLTPEACMRLALALSTSGRQPLNRRLS